MLLAKVKEPVRQADEDPTADDIADGDRQQVTHQEVLHCQVGEIGRDFVDGKKECRVGVSS